MRSSIGLLLLGALAIGGCDRQSGAASQANGGQANVAAPKPGGTLDRSHKGEAAPATRFTAPDGRQVTLVGLRGKPVLLNLWATWCAPCVAEMPMLDSLAGEMGERLRVVTLSQDMKGKAKVDPFFAKAGFKHLQPWLDPDMGFSMGMGVNLPTTVLYDSSGHEVWRVAGDFDWSGAEARRLIAEAS